MAPFQPARFALPLFLLACSPGCHPRPLAAAEGEHEHDPTSVTVFGERLLLFMEYPHLVRGDEARFLVHLTVLATGEPVRAGTVTLELGSFRTDADAPRREGLFVPVGAAPEAGTFAGRLKVQSEQAEEVLELGPIVVHADHASADAAAHAAEGDEPSGAVPFLMEPQWKVRLLLAQAEPRTLSRRLVVPGTTRTPEGASALVATPVAGRLAAPASGVLPRTGERVEVGQVLAFVEPPLGAADLAQLHALELELELKALEVLRTTGEAETKVHFAERERERLQRLRAEGLGTQREFEQAEQELALAQAELAAAARLKAALERVLANRSAQAGHGSTLRFPLTAPLTGTLAESSGLVGASHEAGQPVFRILDSSRLWLEGRVPEAEASLLPASAGAFATFTALGERRVTLAGAPFIGPEVDPLARTLLVRYELPNADGALRPGMLAELQLAIGERQAAVAIPVEAVVPDQGFATAYVMLEGELFQRRELELGIKDGAWVEVLRGIEPGERVATRGAYIVKLAALSPTSFGAGHAH